MPIFEVWEPWWLATGMEGGPVPPKLLARVEATTFSNACDTACAGRGDYRTDGTVAATYAGKLCRSANEAYEGYPAPFKIHGVESTPFKINSAKPTA